MEGEVYKTSYSKGLDRRLIIKGDNLEIAGVQMKSMLAEAEEKKKYKHELLDYLVHLLDMEHDTRFLHQEIALYLGANKFDLAKIYKAADGTQVRSKSEVIICNLLHVEGIPYQYEKPLYYGDGTKRISPDFTITISDGTDIYWEHVGMLGNTGYDQNWAHKVKVYNKYFPGQLIRTYESGVLSTDAMRIIKEEIQPRRMS